ncbi:hypothetical protein LTR99_000714 [Exophiala xenobiotica]|uniref:Uncharacterized protein n=1 Tax=Vermiconidia calcicola TaxID=1690605 RepID=A0AAV9QMR3_9PEZI|nr:hypothetical protein LTR96_000631 [Exophiala xenobiotica]KAK5545277.1 hypothetical protein LTR25_000284 [Vermiconidia calcicola]KAK5548126.1 hypothetical protein LTR23_001835 [Chaetothyriales sp. CCFEE 6169]KAK5307742.1 hypothetical protein LTR99_000714 [Exophiala xenobiotica]KAK5343360.1 hypothetical protein LTR98_000989 [Exophiala xenobiotica]
MRLLLPTSPSPSPPLLVLLILISLSLLIQPALSAKSTATSFCKCICFNNSTIIALNPPPSSSSGRDAARLHNLDVRSPLAVHAREGAGAGRDTDDELDKALSSAFAFASTSAAASSTSTSTSTAASTSAASDDGDEGEDANDHPAPTSQAAQPYKHHKLTCADCTRAFCLDYNLPICKNAEEEDVFTTCFQRDSLKDETVVVVFIFATAGLLGWALVKPWIDRLRERNTFMPLPQR